MSELLPDPAPASPHPVPPPRAWPPVVSAGVLAALAPFVAQYIYLLNFFYVVGVSDDTSELANIVWHGDWQLTQPPWYAPCSFFAHHITTLAYPFIALSYILPAHIAEFYSAIAAASYALLAVAMYYTLAVCLAPSRLSQTLGLALVSILFAFNGLVIQALWYGHFEYAIPAFIILFLVAFKRGNPRWAVVWLVLLLSVREDAGLHVAGILILLSLLDWWRTRKLAAVKANLTFAAIATAYSVVASLITSHFRTLCGGGLTLFQAVYTGVPAYAHLNLRLLAHRTLSILQNATYLPAGAAVTLACALYRRNLYLLVGFAAFIPWFLLNWTAVSPAAGELQGYYEFPFMVAMGWPIVAVLCQYGRSAPRSTLRDAFLLQTVLVLVGLVVWDRFHHRPTLAPLYYTWSSYRPKWIPLVDGRRTDIRPATWEVVAQIAQNQELGFVVADAGVLAWVYELAPHITSVDHFNSVKRASADTVAYFCQNGAAPPPPVIKAATTAGLTHNYRAYPTNICLVTNRSQQELGQFGHSLQPKPFDTSAGGTP